MRFVRFAVVVAGLLVAPSAHAEEESDRVGSNGVATGAGSTGVATGGGSTGVATGTGAGTGGPRVSAESEARSPLFDAEWQRLHRGWALEGALGSTFTFAGRSSSRGYDTDLTGLAVLGVHRRLDHHSTSHEKGDFPEVEATRWCVPIMCGGLGLLVAPTGVVVGDEIGLDLRFTASPTVARGAVRLFSRYGRGKLRTTSVAGFMVPEIALSRARYTEGPETSLTLGWSLFPVDVLLTDHVAIGVDPIRAGMVIGLDRQSFRPEGATELTLRFVL